MEPKTDICVFCHYARMRKDICGTYCAGAFWKNPDGSCDHFEDYAERKKKRRWREATRDDQRRSY